MEIEKATGIKATTSVLALNKALKIWDVDKIGLVTPYMDDVQHAIIQYYRGIGIEIGELAERHLRAEKNMDIADIGEATLDFMVEEVVQNGSQMVTIFCTNLVAAQRVPLWEEVHGIPVFDAVTTVVWDMLQLCGIETKEIQGWGRISAGPRSE